MVTVALILQWPNAVRISQNGGTSINAIVIWTCDACYQGGGAVVCQSNGQWSISPTCNCKFLSCNQCTFKNVPMVVFTMLYHRFLFLTDVGSASPCPDPGHIANGIRQGAVLQNYPCNSIVAYSCNYGYTLQGLSVVTCGPNGQWSTKPICAQVSGWYFPPDYMHPLFGENFCMYTHMPMHPHQM